MKINVIGTSGSGKSTFAHRLAERLDLPYIEMDSLFWLPNWKERSDEDFFARLEAELRRPGWVLDGNYTRTQFIKWRNVDMIVWLDYGFYRTLFQALRRALTRSWKKNELWPGTGNRESFRRSLFSRNSILLWTLKTYRANRKKYLALTDNTGHSPIQFVHLRSPQETKRFLDSIQPV